MEYKKIFKSRKIRSRVLKFLSFLPDENMIKLQYYIKLNRKLNLAKPERYTEKIQWYKINYKNDTLHTCVDKFNVRSYVANKGLEDILIPLYKKYNNISEIQWDELPSSFVVKTTNGGGGLNIVICKDKENIDKNEICEKIIPKKIAESTGGREWAYYNLEPGVIIEQLLVNEENPDSGVNDYKILCFDGKPKYIVVDVERYIEHKRCIYDIEWNRVDVQTDCPNYDEKVKKPENLDEMLKMAAVLSEEFPHVRVDLYNVNGKIYFGEMTFYPWSGYVQFEPDEFDYVLGKEFTIGEHR